MLNQQVITSAECPEPRGMGDPCGVLFLLFLPPTNTNNLKNKIKFTVFDAIAALKFIRNSLEKTFSPSRIYLD